MYRIKIITAYNHWITKYNNISQERLKYREAIDETMTSRQKGSSEIQTITHNIKESKIDTYSCYITPEHKYLILIFYS